MTTKIARHAGAACAIGLLLIVAVLAFAFSGCGRPNQPSPPHSEPITAVAIDTARSAGEPDQEFVRTNSDNPNENGPSRQITPAPQAGAQRGFLGRIFRGKNTPTPSKAQNLAGAQPGPRKCKGCTFNIVAGDQTNAGKKAQVAAGDGAAVVVAAKKSTAVAADSGAEVKIATSRAGPAAAGEGIEQHQETQKKTAGYYVARAVAVVAGFGIVYWLLLGGGGTLLLALWRKNKPDNQA